MNNQNEPNTSHPGRSPTGVPQEVSVPEQHTTEPSESDMTSQGEAKAEHRSPKSSSRQPSSRQSSSRQSSSRQSSSRQSSSGGTTQGRGSRGSGAKSNKSNKSSAKNNGAEAEKTVGNDDGADNGSTNDRNANNGKSSSGRSGNNRSGRSGNSRTNNSNRSNGNGNNSNQNRGNNQKNSNQSSRRGTDNKQANNKQTSNKQASSKQSKLQRQWYRVDLHLHTPASNDYEDADITYLDWMREAFQKGLDIVAITDHNTVAGISAIRDEMAWLTRLEKQDRLTREERKQLDDWRMMAEKVLVLPGFEFTATLGFHILGIFPPETPIRHLELVLLQLNVPTEKLDEGSSEIGSSIDVLTAYKVIREAGGMAIAAHANMSHGVAMRDFPFGGQTKIAYTQDENLDALEVTDHHKRYRSTARFFNGSKVEYPRRMHCIQGSDAHRLKANPDNPKRLGIGERPTEFLLEEPSFDAIAKVLRSKQYDRTRPARAQDEPYDPVSLAREEGPGIEISFHESASHRSGRLTTILNDVCAFANTMGGSIFVGASYRKDKPKGVPNPEEIQAEIQNGLDERLAPPLDVKFDIQETQNVKVLRVQVPKGDERPYCIDGHKLYIRDESDTNLAVRDEIVALVQEVLDEAEKKGTEAEESETVDENETERKEGPSNRRGGRTNSRDDESENERSGQRGRRRSRNDSRGDWRADAKNDAQDDSQEQNGRSRSSSRDNRENGDRPKRNSSRSDGHSDSRSDARANDGRTNGRGAGRTNNRNEKSSASSDEAIDVKTEKQRNSTDSSTVQSTVQSTATSTAPSMNGNGNGAAEPQDKASGLLDNVVAEMAKQMDVDNFDGGYNPEDDAFYLPQIGVEIIETSERNGKTFYALQDLRSGHVIRNVTRKSARKLWSYAIECHEEQPVENVSIQWQGPIGLIHEDKRSGKMRYDLALRENGDVRIFYGVTEEGMDGRWSDLLEDDE